MTVRELLESTSPRMDFMIWNNGDVIERNKASIVWEEERNYFEYEITSFMINPRAVIIRAGK